MDLTRREFDIFVAVKDILFARNVTPYHSLRFIV